MRCDFNILFSIFLIFTINSKIFIQILGKDNTNRFQTSLKMIFIIEIWFTIGNICKPYGLQNFFL